MDERGKNALFDFINLSSFFLTLANYDENLNQTKAQQILDTYVSDIHKHLDEQDKKINDILKMLQGGNRNEL